jgi:hypothetical protein
MADRSEQPIHVAAPSLQVAGGGGGGGKADGADGSTWSAGCR